MFETLFEHPVTVFLTSFQDLATMSHKKNPITVVLGTGGTIAGVRKTEENPDIYKSGQLGITDILGQAGIDSDSIEFHDVARIDSKNMVLAVWQALLQAVAEAQQRDDVNAVLITHGTDTIEETAYLLHAFGPWPKPLLLTCAMRPADHPQADGPGNLRQALLLARTPAVSGVHVVFNSQAHAALHVQKTSTDVHAAFSSGSAGCSAQYSHGVWQWHGALTAEHTLGVMPSTAYFLRQTHWPRVEWLTHHAASTPALIHALLQPSATAAPLRGLVVAGTGAGTFSPAWEAGLQAAVRQGVQVWISSRCTWGQALPQAQQNCGELTGLPPAKACMALALQLMAEDEKSSAA
jgi:L-asparaginase